MAPTQLATVILNPTHEAAAATRREDFDGPRESWMKRRPGVMKRTIVLVGVSLAVFGVAGCTQSPAPQPSPSSSPSRTPNPFAIEKGVRPVRMASGVALSYLQAESASQVLCQALPVERWQQLLGSKVGRRPVIPPESGCFIGADTANVQIYLGRPAPGKDLPSRVAGRPAEFASDDGIFAEATVALTDDYKSTREYAHMRPLLTVSVAGYQGSLDEDARRSTLTGILDALVPVLAAKGEQVPAVDADGNIKFVRTPVTPSTLVDLPKPTQALQLCTALTDLGGHDLHPHDELGCRSDYGPYVSLDDTRRAISEYTAKIGGRPAVVDSTVSVRLRDDVPVDLVVTGDGAKALADKLVPMLT